jgi:hypothetical protein
MDWSYVAGYFDGEGHVHFKAAPSRPNYKLVSLSWANTHLGSLEAIRDFMGCGIVQNGAKKAGYRPGYFLMVARVEDILRVGECLVPHLIVKREALIEMLAWAREHRQPQTANWGLLAKLGVEEVTRLYHEEGLTQKQIAMRVGVGSGAVANFFLTHGINGRRRGPAEGAYGILTAYGYDNLRALYEQGMTLPEIAKEVGVKAHTVYMHFYVRGIRLTKPIRRARAVRHGGGSAGES